MPYSVATSTNLQVMPYSLCTAFERADGIETDVNEYADGFRQIGLKAASFTGKWVLKKKLTAFQLSTLVNFIKNLKGAAFYFYDVNETLPKFSYDTTGVSTFGRYIVHAEGPLEESLGMRLAEIGITLVEQV